jgi:hypothetical protein
MGWIDDPITELAHFTNRRLLEVGRVVGDGIGGLIYSIKVLVLTPKESRKAYRRRLTESEENARIAGCKKVTLDFATMLGYISREVMSKEELESLIFESGITPQELRDELQRRIAKIPGIFLGKQKFEDMMIEMKLPYSLRDRHCYLIGKSGSGKTNLIRGMLLQDIFYGGAVGVLAPEQELITEEILPYIPNERIDDVVYVNPADKEYPIAFNPLYLDEGESIDDKVDEFVTLFKRAVGDTGFRMDKILSETLYALINRPNSTLDDIERFLSRTNPAFRDQVLKSADERTRLFFDETYPTMDRNAATPVLTRLSAFTRRENVRNILCRTGKSFNFRRAMDDGKIILFNLSDGILGEQASQLLGQIIISKLQLAAMSRADTPKAQRHPFYLYLDEFQTFTGVSEASYSAILSRARKYKLSLCLAHQQTGQISLKLLKDIFGNVLTLVSFNVSHDDAEKLSAEFTYQEGIEVKHIPSSRFLRLQTGEAICKIGKTVFPMQTFYLPSPPRPARVEYIINRSRQNYSNGANWEVNIKPFDERKLLSSPNGIPDDDTLDPDRIF